VYVQAMPAVCCDACTIFCCGGLQVHIEWAMRVCCPESGIADVVEGNPMQTKRNPLYAQYPGKQGLILNHI